MQKYVIIFLSVAFLVFLGGAWWKQRQYLDELHKLNNALTASQQLVKETQSAYSSKAFELENLKAQNKDLQAVIKRNKEEIFALTNISLQWKDKYYQIKDAKQQIVDSSGSQPVSLPSSCTPECFDNIRFKVEFDNTIDDLQVKGYTLTNPAYASINLHWIKPLELQLVLTKAKDGSFKVYIDSQNNTFVPTELLLKVDPSILGRKWFEKISINGGIGFGHTFSDPKSWGGYLSAGVGYLITPRINVGLNVTALYNRDIQLYYGVQFSYYPFAAAR